ncbi:fungal-specific transcription factor domain-containing protein [Mycena epipterygia]|nr:fungal-specific transcription factor domain-containing protein [Mycena epipterygia]
MSSQEEGADGIFVPSKRRRVQRACDMCRHKKRACDGLRMSEKKCSHCIEGGLECTFGGAVTKRLNYVDALEARLELTEQLLRKERISILSSQVPAETTTMAGVSPAGSQWSSDSLIARHPSAAGVTAPGPGVELAALTIRSMNTPAPPPHGDDLAHLALTQVMSDLSLHQHHEGFHGKSSGAMLVKAAIELREGYEEKEMPWTSRRMHYWTFNPAANRHPHVGPYVFPESDLLSALVALYFDHMNLYYPLLHRPTFERSIASRLHTRDASFGAVVLLVCAIASRFSDDVRVCPPGAEPLRVGWQYFDQLPHVIDHLFVRPALHHIQYYCLAVLFLDYVTPSACWTWIGIGIRMAQDVGAHRARNPGQQPTVESELWKRAFWLLVCLDRQICTVLGRPCTTQYEDFDAELLIECDDEFWENADPVRAFKQPVGKPSRITFFNCLIRLNNIQAFSLKMLYGLNKTKDLLTVRDDAWEEHVVAELDSALNGWVDSIPSHLRWDPNRPDDTFFDQSALLYCTYYQLQMTIHRPFIPTIRKGAATSLPSLAICTNAARSCSHIVDLSRRRHNNKPVPFLVPPAFVSAMVLLLNVWSGKHTGLPPHMNTACNEVYKMMGCIRLCETRWQTSGFSWDLLYELAAIGQLPMTSPPALRPKSTPGPNGSNKRAREDDLAQHPQAGGKLAHHPTYSHDTYLPAASAPTTTQIASQFAALPTYTADLGRLPIFNQYAESTSGGSSWCPPQTGAPLGYPDFAVDAGLADDGIASAFDAEALAFAADEGYAVDFGVGLDDISSDAIAMWANAPTGFQIDDWGTYFNVMSELNQGQGTT